MTGKEFIEDRINTGSRFLVNLHKDSREHIALLLEQYAALRIHAVIQRSEQFCFCGAKQKVTCGDNRAYKICENGHEY